MARIIILNDLIDLAGFLYPTERLMLQLMQFDGIIHPSIPIARML